MLYCNMLCTEGINSAVYVVESDSSDCGVFAIAILCTATCLVLA